MRSFRHAYLLAALLASCGGGGGGGGGGTTPRPNSPPQFTGFAISPTEPFTDADLVAGPAPTDADGDRLQVVYRWRRNGIEITGQTDAVLPASESQHFDIIDVIATVSDGMASVSAQAAPVTILDSPPELKVPSPPASATYASTVSFNAVVDDLDNDPIPPHSFKVDFGPAGLSIDPTTGAVSWIPSGAMFGPPVDNHWSIGVDGIPGDQHVLGTVTVDDPSRQLPLMRTAGGLGFPPRHGVRIGDFDGDGDSEMLILAGGAVQEYAWNGSAYEIVWTYPFAVAKGTPFALAVRDVDDDGKQEIFLAGERTLTKLDGATRRPVATATFGGSGSCMDLEATDLTNDGPDELVCLTRDYGGDETVALFAASDLRLLQQSPIFRPGAGPDLLAVGNVDGDPALEIVTGHGNVFDGATLAIEWARTSFDGDIVVGDVTGDGIGEIVVAVGGLRLDIYSATQKTRLLTSPFHAGSVLLANLDANPALEIIATDPPDIAAFHYDAAAQQLTTQFQIAGTGIPFSAALAYGNVDGDAEQELVIYGHPPYVIGLDPPRTLDWPDVANLPLSTAGPFFGGMLADDGLGHAALLFSSGHGADARIIELSPAGLTTSPSLAESQSEAAPFVTADYDGDHVDEVLLASDVAHKPQLFAYDFFASKLEWSSPLESDNEYVVAVASGDFTGDGHDDLLSLNRFGRITLFDVFHGALIGQADALADGVDVTLANLDSDPRLEVIAASKHSIVAFDVATSPFSLTTLSSYASPNELQDLATGDVDGDGKLEVLALGVRKNGLLEPARVERLTTGLVQLGEIITQTAGNQVAVERSTNPRKNLLIATSDGGAGIAGPALVGAFDAFNGSEIWRSPGLLGTVTPNTLRYVDLPGDNRQRLAFGTTVGMYLTQ